MSPKRKTPRKPPRNDSDAACQRSSANKRERQRTKELNEAFSILRNIIPSMPSDKMSKIHTLRIATDYVKFLDQMKRDGCKFSDLMDDKFDFQRSFSMWRSAYGVSGQSVPLLPSAGSAFTPMSCPIAQMPYYNMGYMLKHDYGDNTSSIADEAWA